MPDERDRQGDNRKADREREAEAEERRRRRAGFLGELAEAKALRERVRPRHARVERLRRQLRMRSLRG